MGKQRNFLSAGERLKGFLLAIVYCFIAFGIGELGIALGLFTKDGSTFIIISAFVNVVFYFLINFFAAKGKLIGKIAFSLCLVIEIGLLIGSLTDNTDPSITATALVPTLLALYVLDYLNIFKILFGDTRYRYGIYAFAVTFIFDVVLTLLKVEVGTIKVISIVYAILVHGVTVYCFIKVGFPFGLEEVSAGSNTGGGSSNSGYTPSNSSNNSDVAKTPSDYEIKEAVRLYVIDNYSTGGDVNLSVDVDHKNIRVTGSVVINDSMLLAPTNDSVMSQIKSNIERGMTSLQTDGYSTSGISYNINVNFIHRR